MYRPAFWFGLKFDAPGSLATRFRKSAFGGVAALPRPILKITVPARLFPTAAAGAPGVTAVMASPLRMCLAASSAALVAPLSILAPHAAPPHPAGVRVTWLEASTTMG